jgi:hypothetical protein
MQLTKPPPPPPKFLRGQLPAIEPKVFDRPVKQLEHYPLPMASEYVPAWLQVLRDCRYPTDVVVIDFETYFDAEYFMARGSSGDGLTTVEYVTDARFEALGVAVTPMSGEYPFADYTANTHFWHSPEGVEKQVRYLQSRYGENLERCTVVFQNANFDALVLALRYGVFPKFVIDTLALARHWHSRTKNDLGTQAKRYHLIEKGKTEEFKGLTFQRRFAKPKSRKKGPKLPVQVPVITPEQIEKLAGYACNDAMREWELFTILLPKLSNPETELRLIQHTLELWTKPLLKVDQDKGKEIVAAMEAEIDKALAPLGISRVEISGNKTYEALLTAALIAAGDDVKQYLKPVKGGKFKFADAKTDNFLADLTHHADERVRQIMQARIAIKSWPLHIARVERIMRMAACGDGWLGVPLKYCGAHTGRWSGGEKINLQNLGSRGHALVSAIRHMLIAPDGSVLVIADAAQIEARVLDWIAGETDSCQRWAKGEDQYSQFATTVVGYPVRKPRKTDLPAIAKRLKWARDSIGKVGVLGCGYGMGAHKAVDYAQGQIDFEMAEKVVKAYRESHANVVRFWKDIEKAFIYTAKYKKSCSMPRGLRFDAAPDCDVVVTLPNGRELKYHRVRLVADDYGDTIEVYNDIEHHWEHVWGGHLTENVVQAMSRDILAEAMLRVEDEGHRTGLHVHDEIVPVVLDDKGEAVLKLAITEMARRPAWAPDCPLGAEGQLSKRYMK